MQAIRFVVSVAFAFTVGCVSERTDDPDDGDGDGEPEVEADWLLTSAVTALATDATHLYVVADGGSLLQRVPLAGGTPETLHALATPAGDDFPPFIGSIYLGPDEVVFVVSDWGDIASGTGDKSLHAVSKGGGPPRELARSTDSRSFLGVTVADGNVYYSSAYAVSRVPLAGGTSQFVGESPDSTRYWIYSPVVIGADIYWTELGRVFRMAKNDPDKEGTVIAEVIGMATILAVDGTLVVGVAAHTETDYKSYDAPPDHVVELDPATGALGTMMPLGIEAWGTTVDSQSVWGASPFDGIVRMRRDSGTVEAVVPAKTTTLAVSTGVLFFATETGVTRVSL